MLLTLAALLAFQVAPADTVPQPRAAAAVPADAYRDPGARELVRRARERRATDAREIDEYHATGRERISVGLRALGREKLFFRREIAARFHWRRGAPGEIEVLGGRQVIPAFAAGVQFADGVEGEVVSFPFDPADPGIFGDLIRADRSKPGEYLRHPLVPGSEADYRFRSGDTTTLRLADGRTVRLLELQVLPRRKDSRLLQGSLWLDADRHAVVRAVFRLARPFDLDLDADRLDPDDDDDDVPAFLKPIRADLRFFTVEYALWNGRWWLPRLLAVDAVAEVNALPDVPVRFERAYTYHEVLGDTTRADSAHTASALLAADSTLTSCPKPERRAELTVDGPRGATARVITEADTVQTADSAQALHCHCHNGRCGRYHVRVPADTAALLANEHLPPSIYGSGETLVTGEQVDRLIEQVRALEPPRWGVQPPTVTWGIARSDLLRYNRVEGLSVGGEVRADFGAFTADASARVGVADWEPLAELGIEREGLFHRVRVAGYRRLATVNPAARPFGLGNSLSALLFARDDGDYFRTWGAELTGAPARAVHQWYDWRLFAERQTAADKNTDFSVPHLFDSGQDFRPVIPAARADQVGAALVLRTEHGLDPAGFRWGAKVEVQGQAGTFDFVRPAASLFGAAPLPGALVGSLEIAAGTSSGQVPVQSQWFLGGPTTVRGYPPAYTIGEAFWRGRAEVATAAPGARLVLFSDAGWAGSRSEFSSADPDLLSAGVGASFLDGLIRFDLARALRGREGWRVEFYLGAGL